MVDRLLVSAPAHLHAGNIDMEGSLGRLYGTLGFTISQPRLVMLGERCGGVKAAGPESGLVEELGERLRAEYSLPGLCVRILSSIPRGVGMGFTTAAALGLASLFNRLYGAGIPLEDAALLLGRSTVSGLGFYSFTRGGMLLDAGYPVGEAGRRIPPLVSRIELPRHWRFIVVLPRSAVPLVREIKEKEEEVLASMPRMPAETAASLARLLLMKLLPAAAEGRLNDLLEALTMFNRRLGAEYWAPRQRGGAYCCSLVNEGARLLERLAGGVAQSSWGPAFYTIAENTSRALAVKREIERWLGDHGGGVVYLAAPDNKGARHEPS